MHISLPQCRWIIQQTSHYTIVLLLTPLSHIMQSNNLGSSAQGRNAQFGQGQQRAGGEKKDWLDKGISAAGDKLGMHIVRFCPCFRT